MDRFTIYSCVSLRLMDARLARGQTAIVKLLHSFMTLIHTNCLNIDSTEDFHEIIVLKSTLIPGITPSLRNYVRQVPIKVKLN